MSSKKQQVWGSHLSSTPEEENLLFCAGRDVHALPMADEALLPYDIWTNRAHAIMLYQQNIITAETFRQIVNGLNALEDLVERGEFSLNPEKEDVHINVESFVTDHAGATAGGSMHTGRSRNDQVACDMRLYLRNACLNLGERLVALAALLIQQSKSHMETVMPGFTHYQPAMITSWGHWMCSYVQGLCRDVERVEFAFDLINRNPLGAAASFGTSWPIDRNKTTELLGFDRLDVNTIDCISSRWENEAQLVQTYAMVMNHLSIISQDLMFLSLPYVGMLRIHDSLVTGSSIMPQKKNPDFAEVIKSKASLAHGALMSLLGVQKGGLSGYNRDTQVTKYVVMDVIRECELAPSVLHSVFATLQVDKTRMGALCQEGFMNAVDVADFLARRLQLSFRECYNILALTVKYSQEAGYITHHALQKALDESDCAASITAEEVIPLNDPQVAVRQRQHQGAPSPKAMQQQIEELATVVNQHESFIRNTRRRIQNAYDACRSFKI